jgi:oligopeptide/dipeptide ABC transporter ATP-binding protein
MTVVPAEREDAGAAEPLLRVEGLTKHFPVTRGVLGRVVGQVRAVDDVSFTIARGETLGLVGESGSGKTTVGRSILRLIEPTAGRVSFEGNDVLKATTRELRRLRERMQIVFQDPYGSLNPRMRVIDIIGEAIVQHGLLRGAAVEQRVAELLGRVGLSPSWINRYPHEFSGGQRQRIGVARAIALEPKLIVCDEPVSALDVSIQAQVVNLLKGLGRDLHLSYLFIAHDLSVVRHISHRIAVMYLGEIVEMAEAKRLFATPAHPYTRALLSAIPVPDPRRRPKRLVLKGDIPSPLDPPSGCRFHTRCPAVFDRCPSEVPLPFMVEPGHAVRCFHADGLEGATDWFRELDARIEQQIAANAEKVAPAHAEWLDSAPPESVPPVSARVVRRDADSIAPEPVIRSRGLLAAMAFLLALLFVAAAHRGYREHAARRIVDELASAVKARAETTGSLPKSIDELGWRLPPIFRGAGHVDPWGRALRYRAEEGRPEFELKSLGADGVPSADDVTARPRP